MKKQPSVSYIWPETFFEQYHLWLQNQQPVKGNARPAGSAKEYQNYAPVFIPVYPSCPYMGSPYTSLPFCPADLSGANPNACQAANNCSRQTPVLPNAYILFLIFILIMLGTRKEQILAVIRKIFQ
ncbi:hypothetical protein L9W92_10645 [Pelotomaculum terephthalicicum JT]|uniref:hypothetical protein n=1 Tax=Pelotomaculum TaxID=191373 RepID=UPI0009CE4C76|nr:MULTISPECIES: hypothetical protein [Pelotomaculum]MCG9968510.1 hypothetical protein [Pelotomaculum terephthalicicum JT]OPX85049.1 MAG: hypothetical protein A4E54_02599 [Pelotomaculum sp. PtaB.Bin117]OPY62751.1 MAG: hypothetical protein A4E56_01101 [Pelotomaculum sp. PtaU1.Bin065]